MTRIRHIGRDRVEVRGDRLTVVTPGGPMPGWEVKRYRAPVIRFDGRTWRITTRTAASGKSICYELEVWAPDDGELTGPEIEYTPEYVALRDHVADIGQRRNRVTGLLNFIGPLTGFLPARTKARLEAVYGIDPAASTFHSVFIEFLITISALVVAAISLMVTGLGYRSGLPTGWLLGIAVIAGCDGALRWSRLLAEERPAPGFYEWLFRRRLK